MTEVASEATANVDIIIHDDTVTIKIRPHSPSDPA
jgi:hypothetical protein